jgi:uncharacterized RDD family membrane protein YckC
MKCSKCGYLGFETVDRCRNCGYDFSLNKAIDLPELSLRGAPVTPAPLDDLSLIDAARQRAGPFSDADLDLDRVSRPSSKRGAAAARSSAPATELPLFGGALPDDEPLITKPSPPRPPLAVRRATPEVTRIRATPGGGGGPAANTGKVSPASPGSRAGSGRFAAGAATIDLGLDLDALDPGARDVPGDAGDSRRGRASGSPSPLEAAENAGVGRRLAAVAIDVLILAAIDAIVVYFTTQICGIPVEDIGILPKGPLVAFLLVQNGGYLVAFTAGGQTLGKMATGIRVVATESDRPLDCARALVRTMIWFVLALPAGLGFLTLFNRDRRGLHDRCAGTRVVRASA